MMHIIKGYMVRMWTSDGKVNNEKFFKGDNMLAARQEAFAYAENLAHVMEEARRAGVIEVSSPVEILDPETELEQVVLGNVFISVLYDDAVSGSDNPDEDIIQMFLCGEEDLQGLPMLDGKMAGRKTEIMDLTDPETCRVRNREAWYYIRHGGFDCIRMVSQGEQAVMILKDDYERLREKQLL